VRFNVVTTELLKLQVFW